MPLSKSELDDLTTDQRNLLEALLAKEGLRVVQSGGETHVKTLLPPPSPPQQRMWLIEQLEPGTTAYNVCSATQMDSAVNVPALAQACTLLCARHDALRCGFHEQDGVPVQALEPDVTLLPRVVDLGAGAADADADTFIGRLLTSEAHDPLDISAPPLLRVAVFCLGAKRTVLALTTHHLIADGWAIGLLVRDLLTLYHDIAAGMPVTLKPPGMSYADAARRDAAALDKRDDQLEFWRGVLTDAPSPVGFPPDHPRRTSESMAGALETTMVPGSVTERLDALAKEEGATSFMVFAAAVVALLHRYTHQSDILTATSVSRRGDADMEDTVCYRGNTLMLRSGVRASTTFRELVGEVRESLVAALSHQDIPFERLVEELPALRGSAMAPPFRVFFTYHEDPLSSFSAPGLQLTPLYADRGAARFEVAIDATATSDGLTVCVEYRTALFEAATIRQLMGHLATILEVGTMDADLPIAAVSLSRDEGKSVPESVPSIHRDQCAHHLFESQAATTPDAVAIALRRTQVTFRELDRRANRIAHHLIASGAQPGSRIAIYLDRSPLLPASILATLKVGAAFVPLDPALPEARSAMILEDARSSCVITQTHLRESVEYGATKLVDLDRDHDAIAARLATRPAVPVSADLPAYVIFTSGSTDRPKGVEIRQRSLVNLLLGMGHRVGFRPSDSLLAVTTVSFDIAILELLLPLVAGGRLELDAGELTADGELLAARIQALRPNVVQATPSTWRLLNETGWANDDGVTMLCGGEALPVDLARALSGNGGPLWNLYGPTETTIWSTASKVPPAPSHVSIAGPVANTEVRLLDPTWRPAVRGAQAELAIAGEGVATGYVGRPALTADRFIPDASGAPGERLFRTGDLARERNDGSVEFLGRYDSQIKLRGYRIELGEIEAGLAAHEQVSQAVVGIQRNRRDYEHLVAHIVAKGESVPAARTLRDFLRETLPDYMVPSRFEILDRLPLTAHNKVDRNRLAEPTEAPTALEEPCHVPVDDEYERIVSDAWRAVLGIESVGRDDDFFALGGCSLALAQVRSRLRDALGVDLSYQCLFAATVVHELARQLHAADTRPAPDLPAIPAVRTNDRPLSQAQEELFLLGPEVLASHTYVVYVHVALHGPLDRGLLRDAIGHVVKRHEPLHSVAVPTKSAARLKVRPPQSIDMKFADLRAWPQRLRGDESAMWQRRELTTGIDPVRDQPIRVCLLRLTEDIYELVVVLHHMACDGLSKVIFGEEVKATYNALLDGRTPRLEPLPFQYGDFAEWQRGPAYRQLARATMNRWRERLAAPLAPLHMQGQHVSPVTSGLCHRRPLDWNDDLVCGLIALARRHGTTTNVAITSAVLAMLHLWSRASDLYLGTVVSGRGYDGLDRLVGLFSNTLLLRVDVRPDMGFADLLQLVTREVSELLEDQLVPGGRALRESTANSSQLSVNPFAVMLVYNQAIWNPDGGGNVRVSAPQTTPTTTIEAVAAGSCLLGFEVTDRGDSVDGWVTYNIDAFSDGLMEEVLRAWSDVLEGALSDPARPLWSVASERYQGGRR